MILGVSNANASLHDGDLSPYPSGAALGMTSYAQMNQDCIREVYTLFQEYLPYMMLMQTLMLVVVEKVTFQFPRITHKIERFYSTVVHDSLLGKDPDIAEDIVGSKASIESISRQRQRNEICISLKRSDIIYHVYIGKNCLKILLVVCLFLPLNIGYAVQETGQTATQCSIVIPPINGLISTSGMVYFQCEGKKVGFFKLVLWFHIAFIAFYGLCSFGSFVWCIHFRSLKKLLAVIRKSNVQCYEWNVNMESKYNRERGKDFLFLFDLLAHCCGIELTLRVLTHADKEFQELFKPILKEGYLYNLEEKKLGIEWYPAQAECWLNNMALSTVRHKSINIDSYEVTIYPADIIHNTRTIPANNRFIHSDGCRENSFGDSKYR